MNFINNGTDERILKSLPTENISEDLIKAMNKQGLVQKEVQVKGKNGQIFTRKQWVRASDTANNITSKKTQEKSDNLKKPTVGKDAKLTLHGANSQVPQDLSNVAFGFTDTMREKNFPHIKNTGKADRAQAFKEIVQGAKPTGKGICEAINSSGISYRNWKVLEESGNNIVVQCEDKLGNKTNLRVTLSEQKQDKTTKQDTSKLQGKEGNYNGIPYKIHTNNPFDKLNNKNNYSVAQAQLSNFGFCIEDKSQKGKNPLMQCLDNDQAVKAIVNEVTNKGSTSNKSNTKTNTQDKDSVAQQKEIQELVDYMDKHSDNYGYQGDTSYPNRFQEILDNAKAGTSYRFMYNQQSEGYRVFTKQEDGSWSQSVEYYKMERGVPLKDKGKITEQRHTYKNSKEVNSHIYSSALTRKSNEISVKEETKKPLQQTTNQKLSNEDAKKKTQSFTSKVGKTDKERTEFMNKVKANKISWKETENSSINWMRCLMAMNKHFAEGGEFEDTSKKQFTLKHSTLNQVSSNKWEDKDGNNIWKDDFGTFKVRVNGTNEVASSLEEALKVFDSDRYWKSTDKKPISISKPTNKNPKNISTDKYDITYNQYTKDSSGNMTYQVNIKDKNGENVFRTSGRSWKDIKSHIERYTK